jgi:CRP/FNR family transcriptional regulator, cyclic AMP receptor protein
METIELLKSNQLFKDLGDAELSIIASFATQKAVSKNTLVISEGDDSTAMYVIKEGKVKVTLTNEDGKELILTTLRQGDNFGELSLLDDHHRSANIYTLENCVFAVIHKEDFYQLLKQNSLVSIGVIKYLCQRVRYITEVAQSLALLDVYGRLVKLLHDLSVPSDNGKLIVSTPLTHQDIASRVGCGREMITNILKGLKKGHYLTIENKIITINKKLPQAY